MGTQLSDRDGEGKLELESADLEANSVGTDEIVDGSVTSDDISAQGVGTDNIEDGAVENAKLADSAVNNAKIAGDAQIDHDKLKSGVGGQVMVANASGQPNLQTIGGDFTMGDDGTATVASEAIGNAKLAYPKIEVIQLSAQYNEFTDNGDTTGHIDFTNEIAGGSYILQTCVNVPQGFAGDTSATIQIGDGSVVDRYNTGTPDVFSDAASGIDMGDPSGTLFHATDTDVRVTVTTANDFTSVNAGQLDIFLFMISPL